MVPAATSFLSNPRMFPLLFSAVFFICILILLSISSNARSAVGSNSIIDRIYSVEVVKEFPHDPNAFTQGLLYAGNDTLFESTGLNGQSSVRRVDIGTGKVLAIHKMQDSYFGEGLTLFGDRLFQVTWLENTGFIYDRYNLSKVWNFRKFYISAPSGLVKTFRHQMQDGWGLATDGKVLYGSDGTSTLYQIDPQTLKVVKKHIIKYKGHEVHSLNELEYVNGEIWANVWQGIDVLNGIAWDQEQNRLFGKTYDAIFG
ncbi:glutaminyl-peptide cyclotransferase [Phtheirospermum japonicum]|uniref:Glutaminyl-peptide cyclotransferase n=1 Tax=Phtheirospermum japonicum TaxID=374723 RepID=A0A830B8I7_9LAMI|nr:glutaminyl-peptide cyclotransferase [Phtheirospermum japonicum]